MEWWFDLCHRRDYHSRDSLLDDLDMATVDETDLKELADFLCSKGKFQGWHLAGSITTYPDREDEDGKALHAGCLELERRGIIYRSTFGNQPSGIEWIVWKGKKDATT